MTEKGDKYLCNILLGEAGNERIALKDKIYCQAAKLFANELFDELTNSGILRDPRIICGQTDQPITFTGDIRADDNLFYGRLFRILRRSAEKV